MCSAEPHQEYIESLARSMREGEKFEFSQLCELWFAIIDAFCAHLPQRSGPGRRPTYSDNTILKIDMLMVTTQALSRRVRGMKGWSRRAIWRAAMTL